jgi:hypothetical protein
MKARISISSVEDLEEEAAGAVEVYENAPEGANPGDDDDPYNAEDGTLVVGTEELEIEGDFPSEDFPKQLSFPVDFIGWDETEASMEDAHGLETHLPAEVTIRLERKWLSESGKSMAIYRVTAEHGT